MTDWALPLLYADECPPCPGCGEAWCVMCECHYFECQHPGPHSEIEEDDENKHLYWAQ